MFTITQSISHTTYNVEMESLKFPSSQANRVLNSTSASGYVSQYCGLPIKCTNIVKICKC